jgi:flagellar hook protein FlgE
VYTILISDKNELVTTVRERIMQRSKLVDNLHFLMAPDYKGFDMTKFTAVMEFITPVSREFKTEILTQSSELYKGMIEYKLAIDTVITKEAGPVEITLSFTYAEMDTTGQIVQRVRKTSGTTLDIIAIPSWCNVIPDSALSALDQRIIAMDARINALDALGAELDAAKADDITYNKNENSLQLMSNDKLIGQKIYLNGSGSGITKINIDEGGNLVVIYSDGASEVVGKLSGDCCGTYIPSMQDDIITFTLSNKPTEKVISMDIEKSNNWFPIESAGTTDYIWREI